MKTILNLEEWGIFLLCIFLFSRLPFAWWWFPALLLLPDIGMLGYLAGPKVGAFTYNLLHHRAVAAVIAAYALVGQGELETSRHYPVRPYFDGQGIGLWVEI